MIKLIENENVAKEVKEKLMKALTIFNNGYYIINENDYVPAKYTNHDGGETYILVRKDKDTEWLKTYTNSNLNDYYNTTYGTGTECHDKTILIRKVCNKISPDFEINDSTLWSFTMILNRFASDLQITSIFWYTIMKLSMPQIFEK